MCLVQVLRLQKVDAHVNTIHELSVVMSIDFSKKVNEVHSSLSDHSSAHSKNSQVLALKGSYHGDTLGAMEAQAPSSYTGFLQRPWLATCS
ncbi:unnamed protein product [Prunus armeniaca]